MSLKKKFGALALVAVVGTFAAVAADITTPKPTCAEKMTFEFKGEPFTEEGIPGAVLPGLSDRITGEVTVDIPAQFSGKVEVNKINSFSFSCGATTQNNSNTQLHWGFMTFENGMPTGLTSLFTSNYYFNPPPHIQIWIVTGDAGNTVPGDTNGGFSWLGATNDSPFGAWQVNNSDRPGTWKKRVKDGALAARMLLLGD